MAMEKVDPELKILIATLVRQTCEHILKEYADKEASRIFKEHIEKSLEAQREMVTKKLDAFSMAHLEETLQKVIQGQIGQYDLAIREVRQKMADMYTSNMPFVYTQKFNDLFEKVVVYEAGVKALKHQIDTMSSTKFIEVVSNEDLKSLYLQSGLKLQDVQDYFKVEQSTAHRYVNGDVTDMVIRYKVKNFLVQTIVRSIANLNIKVLVS